MVVCTLWGDTEHVAGRTQTRHLWGRREPREVEHASAEFVQELDVGAVMHTCKGEREREREHVSAEFVQELAVGAVIHTYKVCVCVCVCVCNTYMYVCLYVYVCMYVYIYECLHVCV